MIFTPQQKDEWLKFLVLRNGDSLDNSRNINDSDLSSKNITIRQLKPLMQYFERQGFLRLESSFTDIFYWVNQEAIDFLGRGGFVVQEEILENNIKKLLLEIENLKKQLPLDKLETLDKIASISNNILNALSIIHATNLPYKFI